MRCYCGGNTIKYGIHRDKQRFKCKKCGRQFCQEGKKRKCELTKHLAVMLYIAEVSLKEISSMFNVHYTTVRSWVDSYKIKMREYNYHRYVNWIPSKPMSSFEVDTDAIINAISCSAHEKRFVVIQLKNSNSDVEKIMITPKINKKRLNFPGPVDKPLPEPPPM